MASTDVKAPIAVQNPVQHSATSKTPKRSGAAMATIEDDDERLLAEIGYEQVGFMH